MDAETEKFDVVAVLVDRGKFHAAVKLHCMAQDCETYLTIATGQLGRIFEERIMNAMASVRSAMDALGEGHAYDRRAAKAMDELCHEAQRFIQTDEYFRAQESMRNLREVLDTYSFTLKDH